ncbi:MAG: hypothetical protein AB8B79_01165 [Granulosicoccus sp.]
MRILATVAFYFWLASAVFERTFTAGYSKVLVEAVNDAGMSTIYLPVECRHDQYEFADNTFNKIYEFGEVP